MDSQEAQNQIAQMISFIASEAKDRASEIQKKGEEEFSIEVHRVVTEQKEKIRGTYEKKAKMIETQYAIAKSMAINKQRLEKIKARQEVMNLIEADVGPNLVKESQNAAFITKLIVQGMLMLLEEEVVVKCRAADAKLVKGCLSAAQSEYTNLIKKETGASKTCTLSIDTLFLQEGCLGGVSLSCFGGKISIDNTVDIRLRLTMEQAKPAIRALLFPSA
mmetsp:Transcript_68830/g.197358  ORF Transcript_68830/g.197358 Transcript_68830/m.197358 type:complete len:219 (+) Transcript_68830:76-732(+)